MNEFKTHSLLTIIYESDLLARPIKGIKGGLNKQTRALSSGLFQVPLRKRNKIQVNQEPIAV